MTIPHSLQHLNFTLNESYVENKFEYILSVSRKDFVTIDFAIKKIASNFDSGEVWINGCQITCASSSEFLSRIKESSSGELIFGLAFYWGSGLDGMYASVFRKALSISYIKHTTDSIDVTLSCYLNLFSPDIPSIDGAPWDLSAVANENRRIFNRLLGALLDTLAPFGVELNNYFDEKYMGIMGMKEGKFT